MHLNFEGSKQLYGFLYKKQHNSDLNILSSTPTSPCLNTKTNAVIQSKRFVDCVNQISKFKTKNNKRSQLLKIMIPYNIYNKQKYKEECIIKQQLLGEKPKNTNISFFSRNSCNTQTFKVKLTPFQKLHANSNRSKYVQVNEHINNKAILQCALIKSFSNSAYDINHSKTNTNASKMKFMKVNSLNQLYKSNIIKKLHRPSLEINNSRIYKSANTSLHKKKTVHNKSTQRYKKILNTHTKVKNVMNKTKIKLRTIIDRNLQ